MITVPNSMLEFDSNDTDSQPSLVFAFRNGISDESNCNSQMRGPLQWIQDIGISLPEGLAINSGF